MQLSVGISEHTAAEMRVQPSTLEQSGETRMICDAPFHGLSERENWAMGAAILKLRKPISEKETRFGPLTILIACVDQIVSPRAKWNKPSDS